MSFIADKIVMDGLTYDDVLLIPAYSEVLPKTVELTTKFSRNIELKVPFVTAAMDTVTEAKMAIAIAREGGIGVIHKNMSIEEQARQVAIVKRAENGMIYDPVTIKRGSTVRDALALMSEYRIGGIPVVDDERYLVGIVTNRDLRFEKDMDKRIDEVMTKENIVTTNQSTDMEAASRILQEHKIEKLPVVDKEGKLVGLITYKDITKAKDKPMACKDAKGRLRVAAGVGVTADTLDRMQALVDAGADAIVIDTAHGHSMYVIEKLKEAKKRFPNIDIVVGNIATGEAAKMLVEEFDGEVPSDIDQLMRLPGVGRKTANVMLAVVWNRAAMAVDTHVFRVSERIGLTTGSKTPLATEKALCANIPEELIPKAHHWLILHGRYICKARRPDCLNCYLTSVCRHYINGTKNARPLTDDPAKKV